MEKTIWKVSELMSKSGVAFGTSGARGLVSAMTNEVCFAYTTAFLQYVQKDCKEKKVAIGGDLRPSTPRIIAACIAAAERSGFTVDFQGFLPSPALALYGITKGIPSIMITGSHIPDDRNGIKFCNCAGEITKADELGIKAQSVEVPASVECQPPKPETCDNAAVKLYEQHIAGLFPEGCLNGLKIAFYEHSAVGRDIVPKILSALGAKVSRFARSEKFIPVDTEAIRQEDCELARKICESREFDCLTSTDGDSDRPLLSDENGIWLRGDSLGILAAKALDIQSIALPVSCSTAAEKSGYFKTVRRTKIGSPFVIEAMKELAAANSSVAGFEANGGFLTTKLMTRDALTPIIAVLAECKKKGISVAEYLCKLPPVYTASGLVREFPPETAQKIIENIQKEDSEEMEAIMDIGGKPASIDLTDGVRITFESGNIAHFRKSGNAPEFRCYTESANKLQSISQNEQFIGILEKWKRK